MDSSICQLNALDITILLQFLVLIILVLVWKGLGKGFFVEGVFLMKEDVLLHFRELSVDYLLQVREVVEARNLVDEGIADHPLNITLLQVFYLFVQNL